MVPVAWALSCPAPFEGWEPPPDGVLPANGEVVWIAESGRFPESGAFFVQADGVTMLGTEADVEPRTSDTYALVPHEPLLPGVVYAPGFTPGDLPDLDLPESPIVRAQRFESSGGWSGQPQDRVHFDIEGVEARVELEITEGSGPTHRIAAFGETSFGQSDCNTRPDAYLVGAALTVRARNVDWAGNTSEW
ncbi:MAG: hypothetical protein KC656_35490, partial [Myxococcales bacterium]|nr:hypothetical protein [Myxococcales bacterium]